PRPASTTAELVGLSSSTSTVVGGPGACLPDQAAPTASAGPVPASLLVSLAVLRRAQAAGDVFPDITVAASEIEAQLGSYVPGATRELIPGVYLLVGATAATAASCADGTAIPP